MLLIGAGCVSSETPTPHEIEQSELPSALLEQTWPVTHAAEESLSAFSQEPGWVSLVMRREHKDAVTALGARGGIAAARAHTEAAFLYRQAALLTAYGLIEVYGKTPEPTDPIGVAHLLTVSYAITGQLSEARAASSRLDGVADDPTLPWHAPWKAWLAQGDKPAWPPDLLSAALPKLSLPPPAPGVWPEATASGELPHYSLPEREGSTASREMADPSVLVALALWHDAAANAASPEGAALARAARAGYTLPVEPVPAAPAGPLPEEILFGSDLLASEDAAFLADLLGSGGPGAVETHKDKSPIAWLASKSRKDGRINAELAVDEVVALRSALERAATAKTNGEEKAHHRIFAGIGYVGALRSLALVAEREGDREASGILRINALEASDKERACPVGMLALAAWDASNRYPMRAQDILHNQAKRYPSIEIARYGLDVLALRVGSERVETPGM